jgi:beta-lactamase regulating signal transducer with metallopeptidase domain
MKNEILTCCYQLVAAAVNGTYQGILITALVAASLRMLRRTNAATRSAVWFGTLLLLALIIPAHYLCSRWHPGINPATVETVVANATRVGASNLPANPDGKSEYVAADALHEPSSGESETASSFRPSPPGEEREKIRSVEGHFPQTFRGSEYVRELQYPDIPTGAGTNSQSSEEQVHQFVLAILEAAAPNPVDESATPESAFFPQIKQKLSWLGERLVRPLSWKIAPETPLFIAAFIPMIWLAIAGAKISFLIWQLFRIRRLKLNSVEPNPELNALFLSLRESVGVRRNVILKVSTDHKSPVVLGFFKPIILLPADAGLEGAEHILRHELAHVRRRDDWANLIQHCIKALFFFHPAIWWVSNRISLEREIACDDQVLHSTRRPKAYALLLADLAGRMQPSVLAPGVSTNQSQLKQRIDMILNSNRNTSPRLAKARLGLLGTTAALLAVAAVYSAPRLIFAQSAAATAPAPVQAPDALATTSAAPAAEIAVSEDATASASTGSSAALSMTPPVATGPKFKPGATTSVDVQPSVAISTRPSIAVLTAPSPGVAPVATVTMAAPVPVAPMIASSDLAQPGQPVAPRPARRPGRDSSLEDRLDRLEKMVESLVAQQKSKPGKFEFSPKPSTGEMKWENLPDMGKQWGEAQADFAKKQAEFGKKQAELGKKQAEFELKRADMQKHLAELDKLKTLNDPKFSKEIKEMAEQHAKMAVDQAKVAEQAVREAQRAARDAQRGRTPHKMRDGQELEGLHKQREMLQKQMEKLDRQIEKLEREQEQLDEQQENDEQDAEVPEERHGSRNDQPSEASNSFFPRQPAAR